jgi:TonB family protein
MPAALHNLAARIRSQGRFPQCFLVAVLFHLVLLAGFGSLRIITSTPKLRAFFQAVPLPVGPADPYAAYRDFEYRGGQKASLAVVPDGYTAHIDAPVTPESPTIPSVIGILNDGGTLIARPSGTTDWPGPSFMTSGFGNGLGGSTTNRLAQPDYLLNPAPMYPLLARRNGWEGTTVLRVEVTPRGTAAEVALVQSSGHSVLDEAATAAVRNWRFRPARVDNEPVKSAVDVPVRFLLNQ